MLLFSDVPQFLITTLLGIDLFKLLKDVFEGEASPSHQLVG